MVVGAIRNGERVISKEIKNILNVLKPLGDVYFYVVESDSQDSTVTVLQDMSSTVENFDFVSLGNLEREIPNRIERLIFCRNVYLDKIKTDPKYKDVDFVIVADLDGVNNKLSTSAIETSINLNTDWAGLFANQSHRYYDLLALRHEYWCPHNVFEEYLWLKNFMPPGRAKSLAIYRRMIKIQRNFPLIPVMSAFGGFAIYKRQYFVSSSYSREERDNPSDIDHVILNRRIIENGGSLFINPRLINASWTFHSLSSHTLFRFAAKLKKRVISKTRPKLLI